MGENGLGKIEAAVTIRILKNRYLSWPKGVPEDKGGHIFQSGDTLKVSVEDAESLCAADGILPGVARIVNQEV